MPAVRIGPKHQVTIPKEVFQALKLDVGDFLDATAQKGRIILTPKRLTAKAPTAPLTASEQRLLARAQEKIERIQQDLLHSKGLTTDEARVAAKAALIDPEQQYWWTEAWQKGERATEADRQAGRIRGPFRSVKEMKQALRKRARARV